MKELLPCLDVGRATVEVLHGGDGVGGGRVKDLEPRAVGVIVERDDLGVVVAVASGETVGVKAGCGFGDDAVGVVLEVALGDERHREIRGVVGGVAFDNGGGAVNVDCDQDGGAAVVEGDAVAGSGGNPKRWYGV